MAFRQSAPTFASPSGIDAEGHIGLAPAITDDILGLGQAPRNGARSMTLYATV